MDLRSYLRKKGLLIYQFAALIDYDRTTLQEVMKGRRKAGKKLIKKIVEQTDGEVTEQDLLSYVKVSATRRKK